MLQDEDGSFRDGITDGYRFANRNYRSDKEEPKLVDHENQTLQNLRDELKALYPNHAAEIDSNGLLFPSLHYYADTNSTDTLFRAYTQMVRLREMDQILQNAQRQGRISFYMTCHGEEAIHIGSASALEPQDVVLAQYREAGLLMWRGFTLEQFTDQCFSNSADLGKGRQMPVHYGSRALNYQTISSPLGTQIPQAAGVGYRLKLAGKDAVATCFFGDGCASTTDFHSGLNFAATLGAPVLFFCRNNGYAISTSVVDQYRGDGIVSRAPGYGMAAIRVDGNDIFAVHAAVREARAYALEHQAPVLIEAMTYRQGHHSTSDDSLRYRSAKEVQSFADTSDPLERLQNFLRRHTQLPDSDCTRIHDSEKMDVINAMRQAEQKPMPPLEDLFTDVYHKMPLSLESQQKQLYSHLVKYPNNY
jgi:2-oxoisovalerate dehydrogenase E1 component alpha subunit